MTTTLRFGIDTLVQADFAPLRGQRVGLVTHPAALDSQHVSTLSRLEQTPHCTLAAVFGPEHGLTGEAQDLIPVAANPATVAPRVRVYSLYGETFDSLKPTPAMLADVDALVIDLVDVGSRYYTFQATMLYCLEAAAEQGLPVYVLDRPNPIGGELVEGPTVQPGYESFVGPHPVATRHGLTMGELAQLYQRERVPGVKLEVVPFTGWDRRMGYAWSVPPSPNMPTATTALVYPGMCLIEGTNLSEGRGTTRPFEYIGFPGIEPRSLAARLNSAGLPGVVFYPITFRPTFQKHAGQSCAGVFLIVTDPQAFRPVRTGLAVLIAFRDQLGERFRWRTERYEFVDTIPAIDLLFGSDRERIAIEAGADWQSIAQAWRTEEAAFQQRRAAVLT